VTSDWVHGDMTGIAQFRSAHMRGLLGPGPIINSYLDMTSGAYAPQWSDRFAGIATAIGSSQGFLDAAQAVRGFETFAVRSQLAQIASSQQSIIGLATRANLTPVFETLDATLCRYSGANAIIGDFAKQMGWAPLLRGYSAPPGFRYDNYLNRLPGRPSARRVALVHHSGDLQSSLVGVEALTAPDLDDGDESELGQELAATVVEPWRSAPSKVRDALLRRLRSLDSEVPGFIVGGWTEIDRPGPVASSVIAHCAAEIVSRTLRALAPDPEVVAWVAAHHPRQQGLLTDRGDPTRQARVRYAVRDRPGRDRRLVEAQIVALSKLMGETYGVQQPVKHENPVPIHTAELYLMSAEAAVAMLLSQTD